MIDFNCGDESVTFERLTANRLRVAKQQVLSDDIAGLADSMRLEEYRDVMTKDLVLSLRADILAQDHSPETKTVSWQREFPSTWWQHWKKNVYETWPIPKRLATWISACWPVDMKTYSHSEEITIIKERRICPHVSFPEQ